MFYTNRRFMDIKLRMDIKLMIMKLLLKEQSDLCIEKMVLII